jgi:hypothetical protein
MYSERKRSRLITLLYVLFNIQDYFFLKKIKKILLGIFIKINSFLY